MRAGPGSAWALVVLVLLAVTVLSVFGAAVVP
jgi:hypothetical protein